MVFISQLGQSAAYYDDPFTVMTRPTYWVHLVHCSSAWHYPDLRPLAAHPNTTTAIFLDH